MADPLHPESQKLLALTAEAGLPPLNECTVSEARIRGNNAAESYKGAECFRGQETEHLVPATATTTEIPLTVYLPEVHGTHPPVLVYLHGGGWTIGSRISRSPVCKALAQRCGAIVVNVEYRLGPEARIPACFDDALSVVTWLSNNKELIGASSESKVGIGGDSAGGTLAAATALDYPGLDFQVLVYPMTDFTRRFESYRLFGEGHVLTMKLMDWFFDNCMPLPISPSDLETPRWSVLRRATIPSEAPPALFIVAGSDPLRDDCIEYEKKLRSSGVSTRIQVYKGVLHAFFHLPGLFIEVCQEAYAEIQRFLQQFGGL